MAIATRGIGKTNVKVSEVAFGCASIGNLYREVSDHEATNVLAAAWQAGIRYFDTAPHYGRGLSETRLGAFLKDKPRNTYTVSTKVGRVLSPGVQLAEADSYIKPLPNDVRYDYSGDGIEAALEGSCARLGLGYIDIVYVHDLGAYTHGAENRGHMDDFLGSGYDRLIRLKERGRIGAFGLGVNENEVCLDVMAHGPIDVILLAGRLTLLDRSAEAVLVPSCKTVGTSLVLGGVFNSGILAMGPVDGAMYDYQPASPETLSDVAELQSRAQKLGLPMASAALHFAQRHSSAASVLLGTSKPSSLMRNLDALAQPVPNSFDLTFS
jgi:D-threo-aldose 1-dehydrogenase